MHDHLVDECGQPAQAVTSVVWVLHGPSKGALGWLGGEGSTILSQLMPAWRRGLHHSVSAEAGEERVVARERWRG